MKIQKKIGVSPRLDMTPLIDVVFLLIIFFMLSSSFILQPGIKVSLPESSVSQPQEEKSVEITVTKEGLLFYNGQKTDLESLEKQMKSLGETAPDTTLVIKADGDVQHRKVVDVMASAKENRLNRLAIATRFKEKNLGNKND